MTRNLFIPFYRIPTRLVILMVVAMVVLAVIGFLVGIASKVLS